MGAPEDIRAVPKPKNTVAVQAAKSSNNMNSEYNLLSSDTYGDLTEYLSQTWREIKTTDIDMYNNDPESSDSKWIIQTLRLLI